MDTKSKSINLPRGVFSWFCYHIVCFTLIAITVYSIAVFSGYGSGIFEKAERVYDTCRYVISGELRELDVYKENASSFLERLYYNANTQNDGSAAAYKTAQNKASSANTGGYVESISKDNLYRITDDGTVLTNDLNWDGESLPDGFNYLLHCANGNAEIYHLTDDGTVNCIFRSDEAGAFYTDTLSYVLNTMQTTGYMPEITFAVRAEPTSYYSSQEIISSAQNYANRYLFQIAMISGAVAAFLLIFILVVALRKDRRMFEDTLARGLKHIWVEIKIIVLLTGAVLAVLFLIDSYRNSFNVWSGSCGLFILLFLLHLLLVDVSHNNNILRRNMIHSVLKFISGHKNGKDFERTEYRKYIAVVIVLIGLCTLAVLITAVLWYFAAPLRVILLLYAAVGIAVAGTLLWYAAVLRDDLKDYGVLMEQVEKMYSGDLSAVNNLPSTSALYSSAMQLNMIRDGIKIAVEEGIKSERTKVELITNVSHDIKTPLTSIIGYIELLKLEEDLPPHVTDYINVISQKSERLRHMIQDIFDVSKAATGNIALEPEYIDLNTLLQQTMADMNETMEQSPVQWRVQIPEEQYPVYIDGQKIYRVFQNLIKNAAQYALEGSRVYITLVKHNGHAVFSMQNISKYELNTDGESLTGRFVRGDDSRSTSGSGLGLSIAKSFTEACGGSCKVEVKGDLFTIEIAFPLRAKEAAEPTT